METFLLFTFQIKKKSNLRLTFEKKTFGKTTILSLILQKKREIVKQIHFSL